MCSKKVGLTPEIIKMCSTGLTPDIDRLFIYEKKGKNKVFGDLHRCDTCHINFTAKQPCVMCSMRMDKERELKRRLTPEEHDKLFEWLR